MSTDNLQSFSHFISRYLPGKIQKISVNAGSTCPNRDGSKGIGGCIYCNNASFSPAYTAGCRDIVAQIEEGKRFFSRKYPDMRYLAYFQSYTSTNAPVSDVIGMIDQAMAIDKVDGVIIGTRPDCMPDELLMQLKERTASHFVMIEYGAESANNKTLDLINRCHSWEETADAVRRTADAGIPVGLHIILGLPGETREDMMQTIDSINKLPVDVIKCHQLQIIAGTRLAKEMGEKEWHIEDFTPESYADLCCDILERLRPGIAVERFVSQAPDGLLIHPRWGLKNYQFMDLLRKKINERR